MSKARLDEISERLAKSRARSQARIERIRTRFKVTDASTPDVENAAVFEFAASMHRLGYAAGRTWRESGSDTIGQLLKLGLVGLGVYGGVQLLRATPAPREAHDHLIARLTARLRRDPGWAIVTADIRGERKPPTINGHRGDIFAIHDDGTRLLVEVEHAHTLGTTHTRKQLVAFERWSEEDPGSNIFAIELTSLRRKV